MGRLEENLSPHEASRGIMTPRRDERRGGDDDEAISGGKRGDVKGKGRGANSLDDKFGSLRGAGGGDKGFDRKGDRKGYGKNSGKGMDDDAGWRRGGGGEDAAPAAPASTGDRPIPA